MDIWTHLNEIRAAEQEHFRQAVRAAPTFTDAWINLASTLGMESKFSAAESAVANALNLEPENAQALQLKEEGARFPRTAEINSPAFLYWFGCILNMIVVISMYSKAVSPRG